MEGIHGSVRLARPGALVPGGTPLAPERWSRPAIDRTCPVCGSEMAAPFVEMRGVPVNCSARCLTRESAVQMARGDVVLADCRTCGAIHNVAFDPGRLAYGDDYENSLHFSPRFQDFAAGLARRLVDRYDLRGRTVLEIGSGKGEFLGLLCDEGVAGAVGYDPSYFGRRPPGPIRLVPEAFSEGRFHDAVDLVCCRHVLEHLDHPRDLVSAVRRTLGRREGTAVYFEVPNGAHVLTGPGLWDVNYPHCSYFTAAALRRLFEAVGFRVTDVRTAFDDQFLQLEAVPDGGVPWRSPPGEDATTAIDSAPRFGDRWRAEVARWAARLAELGSGTVALWGAGAKGVTFLNSVPGAGRIASVVDVNPRKQGTFVPGTGQRIVAPAELVHLRPDAVVVANPVYRDEIAAELAHLGVEAELLV